MESNFYKKDKLLIFKIFEELDEHNVKNIRRKIDYEIENYMPQRIIIDFDKVTFMDSAGIGLLIGRYKIANMLNASLEITNLSYTVRKIFEMSGILRLIPIVNLEEKIG